MYSKHKKETVNIKQPDINIVACFYSRRTKSGKNRKLSVAKKILQL